MVKWQAFASLPWLIMVPRRRSDGRCEHVVNRL